MFRACVLAIALAAVAFGAADIPSQIHLAQGDHVGSAMMVSWLTNTTVPSVVIYGTSPNALSSKATGPSGFTYTYNSQYIGPYTSGLIHHVNLTSLQPQTKYYYQCGDGTTMSATYSFTTPPAVGPNARIVINVMGDLGQTSDSLNNVNHVLADDTIDMSMIIGDLSYADSENQNTPSHPCTQTRWDSWGRMMQPLTSIMPLMVLPGNHEEEQQYNPPPPGTTEPYVAYQARFRMPAAASGATQGNLYYSFETGPVHVIFLDSFIDYDSSSQQYQWLVQDLATIDRSRTPWVLAGMHAPWYNSNTAHHDEPEEYGMREAMEPLFAKYNVDLVFAGHVHAYERCYATYNNATKVGAPTYITIGDGGNREGPASFWYQQPSWSAFREASFGHGRFEVFNATHAQWTWHKIVNDEKVVSDQVWFVHNSADVGGVSTYGEGKSARQYNGASSQSFRGRMEEYLNTMKRRKDIASEL